MNYNQTDYAYETTYRPDRDYNMNRIWAAVYAFFGVEITLAVVGTLINSWFIVAILTSQEIRSCFRNKIICNMIVVHLIDSAVAIPVKVGGLFNFTHLRSCSYISVIYTLVLIQDFVANWLVIVLLVVFIAQIQDFNPIMWLTPVTARLGTVGVILIPWVVSFVFVPVIFFSTSIVIFGCALPTMEGQKIFKSIDTAMPIGLAILLVIIAAALRYRRFTRGHSSGSMRVELISRGPEIDTIFAYFAVVAVSSICDLLILIFSLDWLLFSKQDKFTELELLVSTMILSDARVVLMPLAWILLPDIRQRIKTWRPWRRAISGIDLTVTYRRADN